MKARLRLDDIERSNLDIVEGGLSPKDDSTEARFCWKISMAIRVSKTPARYRKFGCEHM